MAFGDIPVRENDYDQLIDASWFNTIRSELLSAFGAGGYITVEAAQNVAASAQFTFSTVSFKPLLQVQGDGGPVITSSTPFGTSHGFGDGKEIVLLGLDDTNTVTLEVNDIAGGIISNGKIVLSRFSQVLLIYNATLDRFIRLE